MTKKTIEVDEVNVANVNVKSSIREMAEVLARLTIVEDTIKTLQNEFNEMKRDIEHYV